MKRRCSTGLQEGLLGDLALRTGVFAGLSPALDEEEEEEEGEEQEHELPQELVLEELLLEGLGSTTILGGVFPGVRGRDTEQSSDTFHSGEAVDTAGLCRGRVRGTAAPRSRRGVSRRGLGEAGRV